MRVSTQGPGWNTRGDPVLEWGRPQSGEESGTGRACASDLGLDQPLYPRPSRDVVVIPQNLTIKNFLCYRDDVPVLDFTGIHVACLCGPNGHGKSALLDAITWCLWGKARGKTQDDLISYGADETRVELDFLARETQYRVIRSHARGGTRRRQGASDLQLQLLRNGDVQPLTGDAIRQTQARIDQTVGMDYDTFINSAFLLQGRADEFTNKTPSDRKAVLAKILGLETYDRLQSHARERLDESKTAAAEVEGALGRMNGEAEEIGSPSEELAEVSRNLDALNNQLIEQHQAIDDVRGRVRELERQKGRMAELTNQMSTLALEIKGLESTIAGADNRIRQYRDLVQEAAAIEEGTAGLERARLRFEALEAGRRRFEQIAEEKNTLVRAIDSGRARLEVQVEHLKHRVDLELPPKAEAEPALVARQDEARRGLEGLEVEAKQIRTQQDRRQSLATSIGETQSTAERFKAEGLELRAKVDLLAGTDPHAGGTVCPLCQAPLDEDGCASLAANYDAEINEKRRLYVQTQGQLQELETERTDLERDLPRREESLAQAQRDEEVKLRELELGIEESRQAQKDLDQANTQLATAMESLTSGDFAAEEQSRLGELEQQIGALGYDSDARGQSYVEFQELQPLAERQRQLSHALATLPEEEESLARTQEMVQGRRQQLERHQEEHRAGEEAVAGLPEWEARLKEAEETGVELERRRLTAVGRQGYLEGQVKRLETLQGEIAQGRTRLAALQDDQGIYQELVTAFGRQGVQAMLIETVVPRLEEEANVLLGRMTDNRMHVKLETLRERRTSHGDPIETLEIYVSDELGPRSYEMYSGGEAFRVNFALRIALSKVLAQRLGAPLPTLFIDEGFGTQDASGRERILDVIGVIEGEFEKVIVITHLEELKDAFPVRIEVQKEASGSTFWLS